MMKSAYYDFLTCGREFRECLDCVKVPKPKLSTKQVPSFLLNRCVKYYNVEDTATEWYLCHRKNMPKPCKCNKKCCFKFRRPFRHRAARKINWRALYENQKVSPEFLELLLKHQPKAEICCAPKKANFSYYKYDIEAKSRHMRVGIDTTAPVEFPCTNKNCPRRGLTNAQIDQLNQNLLQACAMCNKKPIERESTAKPSSEPETEASKKKPEAAETEASKKKPEAAETETETTKKEPEAVPKTTSLHVIYQVSTKPITEAAQNKPEDTETEAIEKQPEAVPKDESLHVICQKCTKPATEAVEPKAPSNQILDCPKTSRKRERDPRLVYYENSAYYQVLKQNCPNNKKVRRHQRKNECICNVQKVEGSNQSFTHGFHNAIGCHRPAYVHGSQRPDFYDQSDIEMPEPRPSDCVAFKSFIKRSESSFKASKEESVKKPKKPKPYCYLWSAVDPDMRGDEKMRLAEMACKKRKYYAKYKPKPYGYLWSQVDPDVRAEAKRIVSESEGERKEQPCNSYLWSHHELDAENRYERVPSRSKAHRKSSIKRSAADTSLEEDDYRTLTKNCYLWSNKEHTDDKEVVSDNDTTSDAAYNKSRQRSSKVRFSDSDGYAPEDRPTKATDSKIRESPTKPNFLEMHEINLIPSYWDSNTTLTPANQFMHVMNSAVSTSQQSNTQLRTSHITTTKPKPRTTRRGSSSAAEVQKSNAQLRSSKLAKAKPRTNRRDSYSSASEERKPKTRTTRRCSCSSASGERKPNTKLHSSKLAKTKPKPRTTRRGSSSSATAVQKSKSAKQQTHSTERHSVSSTDDNVNRGSKAENNSITHQDNFSITESSISLCTSEQTEGSESVRYPCLESEQRERRAQREWEERQRKKKAKPKPAELTPQTSNDWFFTSRSEEYDTCLPTALTEPMFVHRSKSFPVPKESTAQNYCHLVDKSEVGDEPKPNNCFFLKPSKINKKKYDQVKPKSEERKPDKKSFKWSFLQPSNIDKQEYYYKKKQAPKVPPKPEKDNKTSIEEDVDSSRSESETEPKNSERNKTCDERSCRYRPNYRSERLGTPNRFSNELIPSTGVVRKAILKPHNFSESIAKPTAKKHVHYVNTKLSKQVCHSFCF